MKKVISVIAIATILCFTAGTASADSMSDSAANVIIDKFNSDNKSIGAPIPGNVGYGPLINYFGKPLPSSGFQPVEQLLMYGCWFTEGALKNMLKGVEDAEAELKVVNLNLDPAPVATEDGETRWIKVIISRDKYVGVDVDYVGPAIGRSENAKTTMAEVLAKTALKALENGCNVLHLTAQGAVRDAFAYGWGIGFASTQAQVYNNSDKSNVSVGGFGYSSGQAGMRDKPWLQGFGLIDRTLEYPPLKVAAAPVKEKYVILNNVHKDDGVVGYTDDDEGVVHATSEPVEQKIEVENANVTN